ncbi:MAG: integrase core domain-containing protein [Candidatus Tantalella remota]|nr:integrase core domain-containing protein [Candidatus Tantalella remota]
MTNAEIVFNLRKRIFEEWRYKRYTWQEVHEKYGFGKTWFYKWLKRYLKHGIDGLHNKAVSSPGPQPYALTPQQKEQILAYIYDYPTYGPKRIADNLSFKISGKTVWKFLKKENLNTRRKRRFWAHDHGKPELTTKEIHCRAAKHNHVESHSPGELVSIDTVFLNIKNLGKVFQYTACDTYSSYGWAKVYPVKTADTSIDFVKNHMLKNIPEGKIKRFLSDRGTEFYSARNEKHLGPVNHSFTKFLMTNAIVHSVTKVAHPWTNGYAERLNQTIWQEFYLCRLNNAYKSIDELNSDLKKFMTEYNWKRVHSGYKLVDGGYKFPGHAFFDLKEKEDYIEIRF